MNRFACLLTVRRMFSLLDYLGILAYPIPFVKGVFALILSFLLIGFSRQADKLEFVCALHGTG